MHLNERVCDCSSASPFLIFLGVIDRNDLARQLCFQNAKVFLDKRWHVTYIKVNGLTSSVPQGKQQIC